MERQKRKMVTRRTTQIKRVRKKMKENHHEGKQERNDRNRGLRTCPGVWGAEELKRKTVKKTRKRAHRRNAKRLKVKQLVGKGPAIGDEPNVKGPEGEIIHGVLDE